MRIEFPAAVRDLYDVKLREAIAVCDMVGIAEGEIASISRPIVYLPEENEFDHRYTGDFFQVKQKTLWPLSISSMRPIWKDRAHRIGECLRASRQLEYRTAVAILLARERGLAATEITLHCTAAGVVWRLDEYNWPTDTKTDSDIEFIARCLYGAYLDEKAVESDAQKACQSLSAFMTALIRLDAYNIAGDAMGADADELHLARRMNDIQIDVLAWYPTNYDRASFDPA